MTAWLPGYFVPRLHAVDPYADRMVFHGVPLAWSLCGRAAVLHAADRLERLGRCPRCERLAARGQSIMMES
ncbi:hypothetical protein H4W32_006530 [Actinophytocola algeriensis]|uniref:Uncharacterized protein n=1 Tax=Actinophytocola algeriensis TaxID=1768010 RepID=A0A7W7VEH1_9PSEU|nr:hypothetical protein [Actinophytocola algeriensis]MBE1478488.1 hypothetical protein [Actinophytocola algeriensis]